MGAQKNRLNSFEHPKHTFGLMEKKILTFYTQIMPLSGPMTSNPTAWPRMYDYSTLSEFISVGLQITKFMAITV